MRKIPVVFSFVVLIASCKNDKDSIVDAVFVDSLISNYSLSLYAIAADSNLLFWEKRMEALSDNYVNGPKYASALSTRFRLYGDINDLKKADSLFYESNKASGEPEPSILRTLASFAMLQHRFSLADSLLQKAINIEGRTMANTFLDFDVSFERGNYQHCKKLLPLLKTSNSYGYLFRRSKFEHYNGSFDTSVSCMLQAAADAGNNNYLKQAALSNAGDLYVHNGNLNKAYKTYLQSIKLDAADLHSLAGIGWVALVHDKNDTLAEKIFRFIKLNNQAPDPLLKMIYLAETRNDTALQKEWAEKFVARADLPVYGLMYSKYLIDLYTGILNNPEKAVAIAEREIINRPTPQTYAWYAWALFCNNQKEKAYTLFKNTVSGKPLEGPELYYMGKMMEGLNKSYNAKQFFKAANKNRFDLSPTKQKELEKILE
ncbi:MAG: tetratricopeptide repeat protein [Chitinophagaceae bacterium]